MSHRRLVWMRLIGALLAAVVFSAVFSSASTLGGLRTDTLGAAEGGTRHVTSVQLEWNRGTPPSNQPASVRLSALDGQMFEARDTVDVTAAGAGSNTCSARATVPRRAAVVDVAFPACGVKLWELQNVAVSISGRAVVTALKSNLGALQGSLSSFNAPVVQPDAGAAPGYTTVGQGGTETLTTLRLGVSDATIEQLVGRRLISVLFTASNQPTTYAGTVGTPSSNQGMWVQNDPKTSKPVVIADLARLAGGQAPRITDAVRYRMVLLQPQRLGAGQTSATTYALITAGGTVEGTATNPGTEPVKVATALEPVALDPRLRFSEVSFQQSDSTRLGYCYTFKVTNAAKTPVDWRVTFDTSKPPLWGLDMTKESGWGSPGLWAGQFVNGRALSYTPSNGYWTVGGPAWNTMLPAATTSNPAPSVQVKYCAQPQVPVVDNSTFTAKVRVNPNSHADNVEIIVDVTSNSKFLVPWALTVDLADYVCGSSLPNEISGDWVTRTRVPGTQSTYTVVPDSWTSFVSATVPKTVVFARYNPGGKAYLPGTCS